MTIIEHLATLGTPAQAVPAVLGFWLSAWLVGRLFTVVTRAEPIDGQSPLAGRTLLLELLTGANLLSLAALLAGLAGMVTPVTVRLALTAGALGGLAWLVCEVRKLGWGAGVAWGGMGRVVCPWLWLLPAGLLLLGPTLCLPVGWDEQVYQIAVPARWLADGFPSCHPDLPYAAFPGAGTMPVWLVLAGGGIYAPRLLILSQWLLLCLGLGVMLHRETRTWSWPTALLAAVFALSPAVVMVAGEVYMELFVLLNCLGCCLLLGSRERRDHGRWGIFVGALLATKLTGFLLLPALLAAWFCHWREEDDGDQAATWKSGVPSDTFLMRCRQMWPAMLTACVFVLPFYLRPWVLSGNPFHPYLAGWLAGGDVALLDSSAYHHAIGADKFGIGGLSGLFWNPLMVAYALRVFDGGFGWAYLVVLLLAIIAARRQRRARNFLLMAGLAYLAWYATARQARFLLPAFLFLLPAAALGWSRLGDAWRRVALVVMAGLVIISVRPAWLRHCHICWQGAAGQIRQVELLYSATGSGYLPMLDFIARETPPESKIMLLLEHRTLYLPRRSLIATPFFQASSFTPPEMVRTPEDIVAVCRRHGVTHLLIGLSECDPDRLPDYLDRCQGLMAVVAQAIEDGFLVPAQQVNGFVLYRLIYEPGQ